MSVSSSIGKKTIVALTGLLLIGFLIVHLTGNFLIFRGTAGEEFDAYEKALNSTPLLPLAEIGLVLLFVTHIALALRVTLENRDARRHNYRVRPSRGNRTLASSSMVFTGIIVLGFLVVHIFDFRIGKLIAPNSHYSLSRMVSERLHSTWGAGIYVVGVLALTIHLSHAFRSAFHTLGISHPRLGLLMSGMGWVIAIGLGLGFVSFPVFFFIIGGAR